MKGQLSIDLGDITESDEKRINALIDQYQQQLKTASATALYTPTAPATGVLFNIAA
jgi:hypothetical protein